MNESKIAAALLTYLASGGKLESILKELPEFQTKIESAFEWMKSKAQCADAEMGQRLTQLQETVFGKDQAIKNQEWDLAAELRAKQCSIYESFGIDCFAQRKPIASTLSAIEERIDHLVKVLHENNP